MTGTSEGGKKAAETRGHDSLSEAGREGGKHSQGGKKNMENKDEGQSGAFSTGKNK